MCKNASYFLASSGKSKCVCSFFFSGHTGSDPVLLQETLLLLERFGGRIFFSKALFKGHRKSIPTTPNWEKRREKRKVFRWCLGGVSGRGGGLPKKKYVPIPESTAAASSSHFPYSEKMQRGMCTPYLLSFPFFFLGEYGGSKSKSDWLFFDLVREGVRPKIRVKHTEEEKKEREEREKSPIYHAYMLVKGEKGVKRG